MTIIDKIKLLFKVKGTAEDIYKEAQIMNGTTPGWKTTEFWLNVATQIATLWGAVSGFIPPKYAAIISTSGIAVYTVARTIIKAVTDVKASIPAKDAGAATATVNITSPA